MGDASWLSSAVSRACQQQAWARMVDEINLNIKSKIVIDGYKNFSDLNSKEQAALVEREFHEVRSVCLSVWLLYA